MPTYAAGATIERRYPGPSGDAARSEADPQIGAFLAAGWMISGERWEADQERGAPIGDAIATGSLSYLAGAGGNLVVTFVAARDTDLPAIMPAYTMTDPRADRLESFAVAKVVGGVIVFVIFLVIFLGVVGQMASMSARFDHPDIGGQNFVTQP
jgi:hypothetical protein